MVMSDDALTSDNVLIIERHRLEGRERGRPERFLLVKNGSRCVLVHESTGRRFVLGDTRCRPTN